MANNSGEPLVKLDPEGTAPVLSYNVAQPTCYRERNFIELELDNIDAPFGARAFQRPARAPVMGVDLGTLRSAVQVGMRTAFADKSLFPNVQTMTSTLRFAPAGALTSAGIAGAATPPATRSGVVPDTAMAANRELFQFDAEEAAAALQQGKRLNVYTSMFGTVRYCYVPASRPGRSLERVIIRT
jgi:hypothetical protein